MKKIWNFLKNFIIMAYILLIIFVTICLLSYNDYKVTEFGKYTLLPVIDSYLEPEYHVGDLLVVERNNLKDVKVGDMIFYYRTSMGITTVNYAPVVELEHVTDTETTFTVAGDVRFSSSYFMGKVDTSTTLPQLGRVLGLLQSKWGFLFLGVFPSLLAFLYTLYSVIAEVKNDNVVEEEPVKKKKKKKKKKTASENSSDSIDSDKPKKKKKKKKPEGESVEEKTKKEVKADKVEEKENKEEKAEVKEEKVEVKEEKVKEEPKVETKEETKAEVKSEVKTEVKKEVPKQQPKQLTEEQKKALIEAKMKTMTEEEKKALIEAKLKSMTPEQKKALLEAKKKKLMEDNAKKQ